MNMNPAFMVVANQSFPFHLYDLYLEGVTVKELATAHSIPGFRVEEHIEAVRLSLKYQVKLAIGPDHAASGWWHEDQEIAFYGSAVRPPHRANLHCRCCLPDSALMTSTALIRE